MESTDPFSPSAPPLVATWFVNDPFGGMLGSEQVDRDSKTFKRAFSPKIAKEFDQMASQQQPQAFTHQLL